VEELLMQSLGGGAAGASTDDAEPSSSAPAAGAGAAAAAVGMLGGIALLMGGGYLFREPIKHFLTFFIDAVDEWGPGGYIAYAAVYTGLEVGAAARRPRKSRGRRMA
jgi:hypothetical protein